MDTAGGSAIHKTEVAYSSIRAMLSWNSKRQLEHSNLEQVPGLLVKVYCSNNKQLIVRDILVTPNNNSMRGAVNPHSEFVLPLLFDARHVRRAKVELSSDPFDEVTVAAVET